jgi:hypothetical protein
VSFFAYVFWAIFLSGEFGSGKEQAMFGFLDQSAREAELQKYKESLLVE